MKHIIIKILILMLIIGGCSQFYSSEEIDCTDIRLFNQTPAWELVKAIEKDDSKKIKEILHLNSATL